MNADETLGTCAACVLLKGDFTDKPVKYCELCDSDLCTECRRRYDLRAMAAIKQHAQAALVRMGLIPGRA